MDSATAWKIIGGLITAILGLCGVVKYLWSKLVEAQKEITNLHVRRVKELEEFKRMVESKRGQGNG